MFAVSVSAARRGGGLGGGGNGDGGVRAGRTHVRGVRVREALRVRENRGTRDKRERLLAALDIGMVAGWGAGGARSASCRRAPGGGRGGIRLLLGTVPVRRHSSGDGSGAARGAAHAASARGGLTVRLEQHHQRRVGAVALGDGHGGKRVQLVSHGVVVQNAVVHDQELIESNVPVVVLIRHLKVLANFFLRLCYLGGIVSKYAQVSQKRSDALHGDLPSAASVVQLERLPGHSWRDSLV
mmetsp:Transcript_34336/g.65597  ORF Transcript_34336/g.65597 Transcript_34336/m.65597 type:complete len:240 (-) Transcript_34336:1459-2178(-)